MPQDTDRQQAGVGNQISEVRSDLMKPQLDGLRSSSQGGFAVTGAVSTSQDLPDELFRPVYLGFGSSLGDRVNHLRSALDRLRADDIRLRSISPIYQSPHMGLAESDSDRYPPHLNLVALVETRLDPDQLLDRIRLVEDAGGRVRTERWGPRTIDIDILDYDGIQIETDRLRLQHPGIALRAFVARPLLDIAPDFLISDGSKLDSEPNRAKYASQELELLRDDNQLIDEMVEMIEMVELVELVKMDLDLAGEKVRS